MDDWLLILLEEIHNFSEALITTLLEKFVSPNKEAQRNTICAIAAVLAFGIVVLIILLIKKLRH